MHCHPLMLTVSEIYFHKFVREKVFSLGLYNKSLKDGSLARQLILIPSNLNISQGGALGNIEIGGKQN